MLDGKKIKSLQPPMNASPGELRLWKKLHGVLNHDEQKADALEHGKARSRANLAGRPRTPGMHAPSPPPLAKASSMPPPPPAEDELPKRRLSEPGPAQDQKVFRARKSVSARDALAARASTGGSRTAGLSSTVPPRIGGARLPLPPKQGVLPNVAAGSVEAESFPPLPENGGDAMQDETMQPSGEEWEAEAEAAELDMETASQPEDGGAAAADADADIPQEGPPESEQAAATRPRRVSISKLPLEKMKPYLLELPLDEKKKLAKMINDMIEVDELRAMYGK